MTASTLLFFPHKPMLDYSAENLFLAVRPF